MRIILRLAVTAQGLFMLLVGIGFVLDPVKTGLNFMIGPLADLGRATLRADMFGFFATGAIFALYAAYKVTPRPLLVGLVSLSCAVIGRLVSFAADGVVAGSLQPIAIELVMIAILLLAFRNFSRSN